jgi:uncharacterized protein YegJ (DUF2314 family)
MRRNLAERAPVGLWPAIVVALTLYNPWGFEASIAVAEDKTIAIDGENAEMNAAIEKARASIDGFWQKFAEHGPNEDVFLIKLKLTDGTNIEHFWCGNIEGNAQDATCAIDNDPQTVKNVTIGQRVPVEPEIISDWMYFRDGKIVGGRTIRVLLNYLPPEEANELRARLAEE